MKIQVLTHNVGEVTRERLGDAPKLRSNADPAIHPLAMARETSRALVAVKLERLFAKPFLGSLSGHSDGVYSIGKHYRSLNKLVSGSADGELRIWNVSAKKSDWTAKNAHSQFVRGVSFLQNENGSRIISCSDDKTVKLWDGESDVPVRIFEVGSPVSGIDHHYYDSLFASCAEELTIWTHERTFPVSTFKWGHDTLVHTKFNIAEPNILAALGTDRSVAVFDLRVNQPLAKVKLQMRSNGLSWNPMEPFNFGVANEDSNVYMFDMRNLSRATNILKDHVSAVMDLDFSPTGEEIVTGAYDRSIRIFHSRSGHSRDIYHTKRMQRVFSVRYSMDSNYIFSSSDDGDIRMWRADASSRSGYKSRHEEEALQYSKALKEKFAHVPEINRISKHRLIPKPIAVKQREIRIMNASRRRKQENRRKHSAPGFAPIDNQRSSVVVSVEK